MNILFISDVNIYPVIGGAERVLNNYCFGLLKKGHNIFLFTRYKKNKEETYRGIKIFYYNIDKKNKFSLLLSFLNSKKILRKIIEEYNIDIINIHQPLAGFLMSRNKNTPIIYTFLSPWCEEYKSREKNPKYLYYYLRKIVEKKVLNHSDKIIALSNFSKMQLKNIHNIQEDKIIIIPGGYEQERFFPVDKIEVKNIKEKLQIPKEKKILLTVRNLVSRMGLEELLKAFAELYHNRDCKDLFLVIGGEGELKNNLINLAKELNIFSSILFTGYISDDKLPLYYQMADVFILPTKELEGFGLVIIEALGCGIPVLGTPVGAIPEILSKLDEKFIFKGCDAISIADGIERYFKEEKNKDENKNRISIFAKENYSWNKIIEIINEKFLFSK